MGDSTAAGDGLSPLPGASAPARACGRSSDSYAEDLADFAGHQLCTPQPYVQGLGDAAPFHPTAAGQLAIALADQAVLHPPGA
jgi:hypothetical protein